MLLLRIHVEYEKHGRVSLNWNIDCTFVISCHDVLEIWTNRDPDMFDLPPRAAACAHGAQDISLLVSLFFNQCYCSYCHSLTSSTVVFTDHLSEYCTVNLWPVQKKRNRGDFCIFTVNFHFQHFYILPVLWFLTVLNFKTMLLHLGFLNITRWSIKTGWLNERTGAPSYEIWNSSQIKAFVYLSATDHKHGLISLSDSHVWKVMNGPKKTY